MARGRNKAEHHSDWNIWRKLRVSGQEAVIELFFTMALDAGKLLREKPRSSFYEVKVSHDLHTLSRRRQCKAVSVYIERHLPAD